MQRWRENQVNRRVIRKKGEPLLYSTLHTQTHLEWIHLIHFPKWIWLPSPTSSGLWKTRPCRLLPFQVRTWDMSHRLIHAVIHTFLWCVRLHKALYQWGCSAMQQTLWQKVKLWLGFSAEEKAVCEKLMVLHSKNHQRSLKNNNIKIEVNSKLLHTRHPLSFSRSHKVSQKSLKNIHCPSIWAIISSYNYLLLESRYTEKVNLIDVFNLNYFT